MRDLVREYQKYDQDAEVFGVLPELVPWDDFGVVDQATGKHRQADQLYQHGGLYIIYTIIILLEREREK